MLPSVLIALVAIVVPGFAQNNFENCCTIDPTSEPQDTRQTWCIAQTNTCPQLCQHGDTANNTCDFASLTYNCTCLTGTTPNVSAYGETLPSLECEAWVGQCVNASANDATGQAFCHSFVCGKLNASGVGGGSTSSSTSAPPMGGSTSSAPAASTASSATGSSSSHAAAPGPIYYGGREIGTCVIIATLAAFFGFAL